ncbi:unnamed protein product [Chironomus riparius]|uniref:Uncharacterized protein n=1 Tax=Chironomus riparius TaxID=315576 RepID=A0A9N9S3J5_9DIPT|nr:unnamed protein product [Chironomus riparius]
MENGPVNDAVAALRNDLLKLLSFHRERKRLWETIKSTAILPNKAEHKKIDAKFLEIEFFMIALTNRLNLTGTIDVVFKLMFDDFVSKIEYPSVVFRKAQ